MTAADFFQYCRIAYLAGKRKDETVDASLSGRDMYARYADGRHEGLLDIDPHSAQEFADWINGVHPKKGGGGHPWEIKRGGNTTHIDLSVFRPSPHRKEGFKVELRGESIGRIVEAMRMFLAIHAAGLPISLANPEGVRKRLLAQVNIGIIPINCQGLTRIPLHRELNDTDKAALQDQINLERRKVVQEHAIVQLAESVERRHGQFRVTLDEAARACYSGDRSAVSRQVAAALSLESEQDRDLQRLQKMEKRLLKLTKTKLRREG